MREDEIIARVAAVVLRHPRDGILDVLRREFTGDDLAFAESIAIALSFLSDDLRDLVGFGPDAVARVRDHYEARRLAASVRR